MAVVMQEQGNFNILDTDKRLVAGWATVNVVDYQGEVVPITEMEKTMYDYVDRGGAITLGHSNKVVGKVLRWEVRDFKLPDGKVAKGIWIVAKIHDDYEIDKAVWEAVKEGRLKGFSIGATARAEKAIVKDENGNEKTVGVLKDISLLEISLVEEPANPFALETDINWKAKQLRDDVSEAIDEGKKEAEEEDEDEKLDKLIKEIKMLRKDVAEIREMEREANERRIQEIEENYFKALNEALGNIERAVKEIQKETNMVIVKVKAFEVERAVKRLG